MHTAPFPLLLVGSLSRTGETVNTVALAGAFCVLCWRSLARLRLDGPPACVGLIVSCWQGVLPDIKTYNAALRVVARSGREDVALALLNQMRGEGGLLCSALLAVCLAGQRQRQRLLFSCTTRQNGAGACWIYLSAVISRRSSPWHAGVAWAAPKQKKGYCTYYFFFDGRTRAK